METYRSNIYCSEATNRPSITNEMALYFYWATQVPNRPTFWALTFILYFPNSD